MHGGLHKCPSWRQAGTVCTQRCLWFFNSYLRELINIFQLFVDLALDKHMFKLMRAESCTNMTLSISRYFDLQSK